MTKICGQVYLYQCFSWQCYHLTQPCCVWAASVRSQDNKRLHNPNGIMRWGAVSLVGGQSRKTWSRLDHEEGISYGHLLFIHSISASHHGSAWLHREHRPQSGPSQADSSMAPTLSKSMKHSALFMIRSISAVETCRRKTVWRIIHNDLCINCFCLASNIMCIFMVP